MTKKFPQIAILGGSFNPPGLHHKHLALLLSSHFDIVKVVPCGPRTDKATINEIEIEHRIRMAELVFSDLAPNIQLDLFDLKNFVFTPAYQLQDRYLQEGEVWHAVGTDLIKDDQLGGFSIRQTWQNGEKLWREANFIVLQRKGYKITNKDLPPHYIKITPDIPAVSSSQIRDRYRSEKSVSGLVTPEIERYLKENQLYKYDHKKHLKIKDSAGAASIRSLMKV